METLFQDIRYGARMLWKQRGFTVIAIITLGLGIGANTAIFSLVYAVLIRPLPFPDPNRLVIVWEEQLAMGFRRSDAAPGNYVQWKNEQSVFDDMAVFSWRSLNLTGDGEPERLVAQGVTANFFRLLGIQPAIGRDFLVEDDHPGAPKTVILSHGLWQRRWGGSSEILDQDILLNGEKHKVIGVMPSDFQLLNREQTLWVPAMLTPEQLADRDSHFLTVLARLKDGVSVEQAHSEILAITQRIAQDYPEVALGLTSVVVPLHEHLALNVRQPLILLVVAAGLVLLIACANIASLQLSRATVRSREISVRRALGAGRLRIVRQLFVESLLLASIGGAVGLLVAVWGFTLLKQVIPASMTGFTSLRLDLTALAFTLLVSLLTGIIFGLAPALRGSKVDLSGSLKLGGRTGAGTSGSRLRGAFVVGQVALALTLLVGAALMFQTIFHLRQQYSVLQPEGLLTLRTALSDSKFSDLPVYVEKEHPARVAFYDQVLERVSVLPGVVAAGYTTAVPLQWKGGASGFTMENRLPEPGMFTNAIHRQVSGAYFQAMGIALREGRYFDERDNQQSQPVSIINETMARQYWANGEVLGKRFKLGIPNAPWVTIVGVVADFRQMGMDAPVKAEKYFPYSQISSHPWYAPRDLVIRTTTSPMNLVAAVRREIGAVDPHQPVSNVATMDELLTRETGARRLGMILLGMFAGLALLLACLGIYGVLTYLVAQQTPELGIRLALGAQQWHILALVLRRGMGWTLLGIALGVVTAFILTRMMTSLLFGVRPTDPATFGVVTVVLVGVALLACYLPARRAARIDPLVALRYE